MSASPNNIVLGDGVFAIGTTAVGLTRGGGSFVVEREYRKIEADGDYGPVKGRVRKVESVAKLTMNVLELLPANLPKLYPATEVVSPGDPETWKAKEEVDDADYQDVTWTGKTKGGRPVVITLQNAINLENIDWSLVDKEEAVPEVTYTAAYDEASRKDEPWDVEFAPTTVNPAVVTAAATDVVATGATLNGDLTSLGGETDVDVYFQYRVSGEPVWYYTTARQNVSATGVFDQAITGLTTATIYQFRSVVEWNGAAGYGSTLTLTTA